MHWTTQGEADRGSGTEQTHQLPSLRPASGTLKFLLGEYCLYLARFPVGRLDQPPLDAPTVPLDPLVLLSKIPAQMRALFLPDWPCQGQQPRLHLSSTAIRYITRQGSRYYIRLEGTFEDYLQTNFAAKPRHNLTRSIKKFAEHCGGLLDLREYRAGHEMDAFHSYARQVSRLTYQDRLLKAGLPDTPAFKEHLTRQAARGAIRGYVLFHDSQPVAFAYCEGTGDTLHYNVIGYDPSFARWSPGTVLLYSILQRAFTEGHFRLFDFGPGEAQYKAMFSNVSSFCAEVYYFRPGLFNFLFVISHYVLERTSTGIVSVLDRLGIKQKIKRWLRRGS